MGVGAHCGRLGNRRSGAGALGCGSLRDARAATGHFRPAGATHTTGSVIVSGSGVPNGRLRVRLTTTGRGHTVGTLDAAPVNFAFTF